MKVEAVAVSATALRPLPVRGSHVYLSSGQSGRRGPRVWPAVDSVGRTAPERAMTTARAGTIASESTHRGRYVRGFRVPRGDPGDRTLVATQHATKGALKPGEESVFWTVKRRASATGSQGRRVRVRSATVEPVSNSRFRLQLCLLNLTVT